MKRVTKNETSNQVSSVVKKSADFIRRQQWKISLLLFSLLTPALPVHASAAGGTDPWVFVVDFIVPWIKRFGGALGVIALVEIGIGFFGDRPEDKARGYKIAIAGAIVYAAGMAAPGLLK